MNSTTSGRNRRYSVIALALAVLLFAASMPLPWHHRMLQNGGYVVVHGIDGASWLLAITAIALIFLIRHLLATPGFYTRWLFTITSLLLVIGVFADYIDWQTHAATVQATAFFGAGFFVALAGAAAFLLANALTWRIE